MNALLTLIASFINGSMAVISPNRGREADVNNPQNIVDENDLLKSRLAQAESRNQELEARIEMLEKQVQKIQGE